MSDLSRLYKRPWTEWLALLLVVGVLAGVPGFLWLERSAQEAAPPGEVRVVAERFEDGGWQPSTIRVKAGARVRVRLSSQDVTHGFLVPALGLRSEPVVAGHETVLEFSAPGPGVYPFYCYVLCSHRHGAMVGQIVVEQ